MPFLIIAFVVALMLKEIPLRTGQTIPATQPLTAKRRRLG